MSLTAAMIDALVASGATAEMLAAVMKAALADDDAKAARQVPWLQLRQMAFERDGERCAYCNAVDGPFEVDHIVPRIKGGEDVLDNVAVACRSCNRAKRDREGDDWGVLRERRARDRDRKRQERAMSKDVRGQNATSPDSRDATPPCPLDGPPKDISNPPLNPPSPPVSVNARRAIAKPISGFAEFWAAYPRKTAKAAAEKAWPKACQRQTPAAIIAAATRYAADPPDDPQFIPHPASWLNAARFEDEEPTDARPSTGNRPMGRSGQGRVLDRPRSAGTPRQQAVAEIYAELERAGYGGAH